MGGVYAKIAGTIAAVLLVVTVAVGFVSIERTRSALEQAYLGKAIVTAQMFEASIRSLEEAADESKIFATIMRAMWLVPDVLLVDYNRPRRHGNLWVKVSSDANRVGTRASLQCEAAFGEGELRYSFEQFTPNHRVLYVSVPIRVGRRTTGTFGVKLSLEVVDRQVASAIAYSLGGYFVAVILILALSILILKHIVIKPLHELEGGMRAVAKGTHEHRVNIRSGDEIGRLADTFNSMNDDLRKARDTVQFLAFHDPLTGLPNRRLFQDRLEQAIARCRRESRTGTILYVDLDHFKDINDTMGHDAGDALLLEIATRMKNLLRTTDTAARFGGDEFVVLLGDWPQGGEAQARRVADKLLWSISEPVSYLSQSLRVTASIGVKSFPTADEDASAVLRQADAALYRAKSDGRNMRREYDSSTHAATVRRIKLRTDLPRAIADKELVAYYQRQVYSDKTLRGAEALVRWRQPGDRLLLPEDFIPFAEESGAIKPIDYFMLREVCSQFVAWHQEGADRYLPRVAVNISAAQFHDRDFVSALKGILAETGMDPESLELEITERTLVDDAKPTVDRMRALVDLGLGLSLDDFGTGFCSLSYLKRLPVTGLKIHGSFVQDVGLKVHDSAIVEAVLTVARHCGVPVIAEGVQSERQVEFLKSRGCGVFQGFYFGEPSSADHFFSI